MARTNLLHVLLCTYPIRVNVINVPHMPPNLAVESNFVDNRFVQASRIF